MKKLNKMIYVAALTFLIGLVGYFGGSNSAKAADTDTKATATPVPIISLETPTNLRQTDASNSWLTLSWTPVFGVDVKGYKVYVAGADKVYKFQKYTSDSKVDIYSLSQGQVLSFKVSAVDKNYYAGGISGVDYSESALSAECTAYTKPCDPGKMTSLKQTAATTTSITLEWAPVDGAAKYNIIMVDGTTRNTVQTVSTTLCTLEGLAPGTKYFYYVQPVSQSGNYTTALNEKSIFASTLAEPVTDLRCVGTEYNTVNLAWSSLAPDPNFEVAIYDYTGKVAKTYRTSSLSYKVYGYGVCTFSVRTYVEADGTFIYGPWSSTGTAVTATSITVTAKTKTSKIISWNKVNGAKSYTIYRSLKKSGKYSKIATVKSSKISYVNKKLKKNKKYYYYVVVNSKIGGKNYKSAKSNKVGCK